MATNKVSFYYRKDLNVTKHGEYKAAEDLVQGDAVKRNDKTKEIELATSSADFEGIVSKWMLNTQGADSLAIKAGDRALVGVGPDYEIVVKGNHDALKNLDNGAEVGVANGKFVATDEDTDAVGKVVDKFPNGEIAVRIY